MRRSMVPRPGTSQLMVDYSREYGLALWQNYGEFGLSLLDCRTGDPAAFERLERAFTDYRASDSFIFYPILAFGGDTYRGPAAARH